MKPFQKFVPCVVFLPLAYFLYAALQSNPGYVGIDYQYFLPRLIEGLLFFKAQGLAIPNYSISFCGALPFYADPQTMFYSIPGVLSFFISPWSAVQITIFVFWILGAAGTGVLCKRILRFSTLISTVAAFLFAANGFFVSRMLVGHFSYHAFALIPCLAVFILWPSRAFLWPSAALALGISYFIHSGGHFVSFVAAFSLPIVIIFTLSLLHLERHQFRLNIQRIMLGGLLGLGISLGKLIAIALFMRWFPREAGLEVSANIFDSFVFFLQQLGRPFSQEGLSYGPWEYKADIGWLALLLGIFGLIFFVYESLFRSEASRHYQFYLGVMLLLWFILCLELVLGGGPGFSFLHELPVLSSLRVNARFASVFILPLILFAAYVLHKLPSQALRLALITLLIAEGLWRFSMLPAQGKPWASYPLLGIDEFCAEQRSSEHIHPVSKMISTPGNDFLAQQAYATNRQCLAPNFSRTPARKMSKGDLANQQNGYLNLTDPRCFVMPDLLTCKPGALLPVSEASQFLHLVQHENPAWTQHYLQRIGNSVTLLSLFLTLFLLVFGLCRRNKQSNDARAIR